MHDNNHSNAYNNVNYTDYDKLPGLSFHLLQAATQDQCRAFAGDTYSTDMVQAQLGRDWGLDPGSAIQPCIYTHPSTAELELPESSSVRALAGQPVLSDLFVPFRQPAQVSFS